MLRELEDEKYTLSESLHKLETTARKDRERYQQELEEEKNQILQLYEQHVELMDQKMANLSTSYQLQTAQLELNTETAKMAMNTLRVKYEMGEERVKSLIAKHR